MSRNLFRGSILLTCLLGQLNAEISSGGWIVVEVVDSDPFLDQPIDLWSEVLSRQQGFVSQLAQYPDNPRMN